MGSPPLRDGFVRRAIKRVARWNYFVNLGCTRFLQRLQGEPRFVLGGSCNACGDCCDTPVIQVPRLLLYFKSSRWLLLNWHLRVNGFELTGQDRRHGLLIFRCTHLDPQTRQCDSYESRPGLCRDYPRNLLDHDRPEFLPRCGHCALNPQGAAVLDELVDLELPPEKLARIRKEFYVQDDEPDRPDRPAA